MYLIFETYESCDERNRKGITDLNWPKGETVKRWREIILEDGRCALEIENNDGLTSEEISQLKNEINVTTSTRESIKNWFKF